MLSWIVYNFVLAVIFELNLHAYRIPIYQYIITDYVIVEDTDYMPHIITNFNMLYDRFTSKLN